MRNVAICCSVGRVAADGVWLLFGVMWCAVTAVSDGYGDRTDCEMWLLGSPHSVPIIIYLLNPCSRFLLQKQTCFLLANNFRTFYGKRRISPCLQQLETFLTLSQMISVLSPTPSIS